MIYYKNNQNNNIYAYSKGVTVVLDKENKKWQLSHINGINLESDENVQEISESEVLNITEKSPQDMINKYLNYLSKDTTMCYRNMLNQ